tara:strand:+ start:1305 stop:1709 length:405 start_codon:yes stop_codon:yes gene_type:complete
MKYFVIISAILITGCTATNEGYDYLGTTPYYAVKAPHAPTCPCCFGKKVLTPTPTSAILKVQQSKRGNQNMSIAKNARCSQIIREVEGGKFVKNSKFHSFGSVVEDSIFAQQKEADRRLLELQAQRKVRVARCN